MCGGVLRKVPNLDLDLDVLDSGCYKLVVYQGFPTGYSELYFCDTNQTLGS